jgi:CheY-like chemotaxis protein
MDRLWLEAPLPALCVREPAGGSAVEPNAAALRWAQAAGVSTGTLQAFALQARAAGVRAADTHVGGVPVHCVPVPLPGGLLLWLQPLQGHHTAGEAPAVMPHDKSGLHVLCVEDNPVNLQLVRELIALRPRVRLRTAVDGLSGVAAALDERPDLLLLDLQLPDIDGLEVMRRVRDVPAMAGCRIVALSADAMPDHIAAALAAGFDDYWTKPIQFDAFLGHLDRMAVELG